jgi:single-strand DNA-binding protein
MKIILNKVRRKKMSVNKVMVLGRLGQDPELKHTPTGASVCNFSMATTESWKDKAGTKQERTEWHKVVVWGKVADLCGQYLSKGKQAFVEGKLQTRSWENKEGVKMYTTEINAMSVQFIGGQSGDSTGDSGSHKPAPSDSGLCEPAPSADANFAADEIPF